MRKEDRLTFWVDREGLWEAFMDEVQTENTLLKDELDIERRGRIAAQSGLLPYVQAVEAFNAWVRDQDVALAGKVRLGLRRCGLLDVKVGYEPPHDPNWFEQLQVAKAESTVT